MSQKWIQILVILIFYQEMTSGAYESKVIKEGIPVDISCRPSEIGSMIVWFRVPEDSQVIEVIASFSNTYVSRQMTTAPTSSFSYSKIKQDILTLQSFQKKDSAMYSCASPKGGGLRFGKVTLLSGGKPKQVQPPTTAATTTKQNHAVTASACACNATQKKGNKSSSINCHLIILGPLAGGCGLLLLLLIVIALYCNKTRTKRCPHHYKRKQRPMAPGKPLTANRPI